MFLAVGLGLLVFELFAVPFVTKRIGVTASQRLASAISVPIYLAVPLLSNLHDTEGLLFWACVVLLFAVHSCSNAVSE